MTERPPVDGLDAELLDRYLAGECAEAEVAAVRRHLMAHPDTARAVEQLLQALDGGASGRPAPSTDRSWARLRERLGTRERAARGVGPGAAPGRVPDAPVGQPPMSRAGRARPMPELPRVWVRSATPPHWRRALVTLAASVIVTTGVGYGVSHPGTTDGAASGAASVRAVV
jgi:hypothetical protein